MNTIDYKVSTRWKNNETETANEIIDDQIIQLYHKISEKFNLSLPPETTSESVNYGFFGLKKKITTTVKIQYHKY